MRKTYVTGVGIFGTYDLVYVGINYKVPFIDTRTTTISEKWHT